MSISYIIFVFLCVATSVGLQLYIRKKMRRFTDIKAWINAEFNGDLSDWAEMRSQLSDQIHKIKFEFVWKYGSLATLALEILILTLKASGVELSFLSLSSGLFTSIGFIAANLLLGYIIDPIPWDIKHALNEYMEEHQVTYMLDHLDDSKRVYKMLDTASYKNAQKIIQAFKDTGRTNHIKMYLKKLLNSDDLEIQWMGLKHLHLVGEDKELELLGFAYYREVLRFPPDGSLDPSSSEYGFLYDMIGQKIKYELEILNRIVFHRRLIKALPDHLSADNLKSTLAKIYPITPLKLALTNHPHLIILGYQKLTEKELIAEAPRLVEALKSIRKLSHLVHGIKVNKGRDSETLVITPHEKVLQLSQALALKEEAGNKLMLALKPMQGAQPQQYYCKTCMEKSMIFRFNERHYPICPVCNRLDRLELSVSFPVIVGVIGLKEYTVHTQSKEIHLPVWNEAERKALHTKIEVLEIWEAENLSYDWAINAVVNVQLNLQPEVRVPVRLVGNPPLSQNSRLILGI